jgi:hypothetical protein
MKKILQTGQIRSIKSIDGQQLLIAIAEFYNTANVCEVILLGLNPDDATERDFCSYPSENLLPFGVTIFCDYTGPIATSEVEKSSVVGQLCSECIGRICDQSLNQIAPFSYSLYLDHDCFKRGSYNSLVNDEFMKYKQSEYSEFWEKTIPYDNYEVMIENREKKYSGIRNPITIRQIIDSYSNEEARNIYLNFPEMTLSKRLIRA